MRHRRSRDEVTLVDVAVFIGLLFCDERVVDNNGIIRVIILGFLMWVAEATHCLLCDTILEHTVRNLSNGLRFFL